MSMKPGTYAESSIRVLKGLEPVKQRPGMYTRTDNPLHVVQEVIDNAADEALGRCLQTHRRHAAQRWLGDAWTTTAAASLSACTPKRQVPVLEIVYTRLHAGGKFDKGASGAYSFSGGLHGVGVSVTNALATRLAVTVWREGQAATLVFGGGDVIEPLVLRKAGSGRTSNMAPACASGPTPSTLKALNCRVLI
jgi:topoisomerase-4 subunit B